MRAPSVARSDQTAKPDRRTGPLVGRKIIGFFTARIQAFIGSRLAASRDRRELAQAGDRLFRDIGVSREAVSPDTESGFWRVRP
jgi:uncharacterized protein YjiS (DUF1127 family)